MDNLKRTYDLSLYIIYPLREPDPSSVHYTFIKTEGSQEHGILMTHQQMAQSACIKGRNDMTIR